MDENKVKELFNKWIKEYNRGAAFSDKKITDNPTDALQVANRRFVTLNGSVASRIPSSVAAIGQFYMDTGNTLPMWKVTAGWVNGVGSVVAQNN